LAQCLRLHPNDSEAKAVQRAWTKPEKLGMAKPVLAQPVAVAPVEAIGLDEDAKADPLERIERGFDAVAFHQAALMVEQVDASRLDQLAPRERAQKLSAQAHEYLDHGLLLEAERLYQAAVAVDPKSAAIHAGLAEVHERAGDAKAARKEAVTSLELMPSVDAYLVMVRLEIAASHFYEAQQHLTAALQIDPQNKPALELRKQIEALDGMKK
jgi:tetratricopeptide (TPR) repeat protein